MSSLVSSIFGSTNSKKKGSKDDALSELFDRDVVVPDPPAALAATAEAIVETQDRKRKRKPRSGSQDEVEQDSSSSSSAEKDNRQGATGTAAAAVHDEPVNDRTIFVGNLPSQTTRKSLAKVFKDCGRIESTRIRSVAIAGVKLPPDQAGNQNLVRKVCANTRLLDTSAKSSVQGYVVFEVAESVEEALKLNNTTLKDEETGVSRHIRVDHAEPTIDARKSVFVGNLPYGADEETLQKHFYQGCGLEPTDVEGVRIIRDKETFQCRGFGYVHFLDRSMVATALRKMNGSMYMKKELRVMVCGRRFKGGKADSRKKPKRADSATSAGALRRILAKQATEKTVKKKRARGVKKSSKPSSRKAGVSKRAAAEAKAGKRAKKIQKRISKGMGKARRK